MAKKPVQLPHNWEAEGIALACAVMSPQATQKFCQQLDPRMFWFPPHQVICKSIRELHEMRRDVDVVSLGHYLERAGRMEDAGGIDGFSGVMQLSLLEARLEPAMQIVKELHAIRMIHTRCREAAEECLNPERSLDWKLQMAGSITAGLLGSGSGAAVTAADVDLSPRQMGACIGLGYGLDHITGGAEPGQVNVLQALRKTGKTTALAQMALGSLQDGGSVVFVPIADMTASDISRKMVRQMCGWDKPPQQPQFEDLYYQTVQEFRGFGSRLAIWDPNLSAGSSDIEAITSWLDAQIHRTRPTVVYLDYFQRLTTRDSSEFSAATYATIAQKLGKWAHRYPDIVTWVGSQETADGRAAWTRELENETALLLRMTKPEGSESRRIISVELNRFGPMGGQVSYEFDSKYLAFRPEEPRRAA